MQKLIQTETETQHKNVKGETWLYATSISGKTIKKKKLLEKTTEIIYWKNKKPSFSNNSPKILKC